LVCEVRTLLLVQYILLRIYLSMCALSLRAQTARDCLGYLPLRPDAYVVIVHISDVYVYTTTSVLDYDRLCVGLVRAPLCWSTIALFVLGCDHLCDGR